MSPTRTRRVSPPRYANRLFCLTAGAYIAGLFGRMSYAAVMADLIAQEGLGKSQAGLIGTMFFVVYGVCQLLSGFLGDRISPKKLIFTGIIGSAVLNLGMGLSGASYPTMLTLWTLNGVFQSMLWSPAARVFSEMIPPTHRKRACANGAATYPIATILTYLFASALLHFTGWRVDFLLSSLIMLISAAFFWVRMSFYERETEQCGEIEEITLTQVENAAQGSLIRTLIVSGTLLTVLGSACCATVSRAGCPLTSTSASRSARLCRSHCPSCCPSLTSLASICPNGLLVVSSATSSPVRPALWRSPVVRWPSCA